MQSDDLGLVTLLRSRIGVDFDGEAHLTSAEAQSIAVAIERLVAERDEARARIESQSDYSIHLQRIIEAVCRGNEMRADSADLFHHKMVLHFIPDYQLWPRQEPEEIR